MSDERNGNGGVVLKWVHVILLLLAQVMMLGTVYGALKFQVEDHARRLESIEKKQEDNFIPRSEYDKRHSDLQEEMRELRNEVRELRQKVR